MLRAGASKQAHGQFVCSLCRQKLSQSSVQSSCRSSTLYGSLGRRRPAADESLPNVLPRAAPASVRSLSTTATLRNAPDNKGGFSGGFGGGLNGASGPKFGGFGVKPAAGSPPTPSDGLLPHEREARQRSQPPPPPPPSQAPAKKSPNHNQRKGHRQKQTKEPAPEQQAHLDRSRSKLEEIFSAAKRKQNVPHPVRHDNHAHAPHSSTQALSPGQTPPTTQQPPASRWGSFSSRVAVTDTITAQRKTSGVSEKRVQEKSAQKSSLAGTVFKGAAAWDALEKQRRGTESTAKAKTKAKATTDDSFWGEMETRVGVFKKQISRSAKSKTQSDAQSNTQLNAQAPEPVEDWTSQRDDSSSQQKQSRRKSRFEEAAERDDRQSRKRQKNQKGRNQARGRDDDEWEDDGFDWEAHELRQEEKRQRKLAEAEEAPATPIFLPEFISVSSLVQALKQSTNSFLNDLEEMGFENMTSDTILTGDTAALIAMEYNFDPTVDNGSERDLRPRPPPEDVSSLPSRPPIVTIMGHVDHGKTTLLDYLRQSSVAAQEHGGITQHIGAFVVKMSSGKPITFLDTPGHAAFLTMRQRGANVTDIVVLVVAADDSVKPQTIEALKHAQGAKVPIIVAINKIDKEEARVDQVKADLSRHGVEIEDYGGDVQVVCVSGKTGKGMDDLEENIVTLSEMLDVRAEQDGMAEGWVLESSVKQDGKAATVLVKRGTLRTGDFIAAGQSWARIRLLRNEAGVEVTEAPPGTPVEILGWRDIPEAGELVLQAPDEDKAKIATEYRQEMAERQQSSEYLAEQEQRQREKEAAAAAAEKHGDEPSAEEADAGPGIIYQNYTIKADVAGSVEAVCSTVMEQGNNEVQARILRSAAGQVSESDVDHAAVSKSIIINFNLPVQPHIKALAEKAGVVIQEQSVIYHVVDDVKKTLSDLLPVKLTQRVLGEADVLQIFPINVKKRVFKNIAGCKIRNGSVKRTSKVKVLRRGKVVFDGAIDTLKHVKKDVMEMGKGTECGIGFEGFEDLQMDDQIQTYEIIEEKRTM